MTILSPLSFAQARAQVQQRIRLLFPDANFAGETVFAAIGNAIAGGMITTHAFIEQAARLAHPATSEGEQLDALAAIWNIVRRAGEDDETLRARMIAIIQHPASGGTAQDFRNWMYEIDGVTRAWVSGAAGIVSVGFVYDGRASIIPTADERAAMISHLDLRRPAGVRLYALPLVLQTFNITVKADVSVSRETLTAALRAAVDDAAFVGDGVKTLPLSVLYRAAAEIGEIEISAPVGGVVVQVNKILKVGDVVYA